MIEQAGVSVYVHVSHLQGSGQHCVAIKMMWQSTWSVLVRKSTVGHCTASVQLRDTFETRKFQSQDGQQWWFDTPVCCFNPNCCACHISMFVQTVSLRFCYWNTHCVSLSCQRQGTPNSNSLSKLQHNFPYARVRYKYMIIYNIYVNLIK